MMLLLVLLVSLVVETRCFHHTWIHGPAAGARRCRECVTMQSSYQSFQPLGSTPAKKEEQLIGFKVGLQEDSVGMEYEEYIVNITKPLRLIVEEAPDGSGMVYVAERGEKAAAAGVEVGDVIVAVSFVFGDDFLSNMLGKGIDKVQSMIRSRGADYVCLRLRRGCEYHLMEPSEVVKDEEESKSPEELEALWIARAKKIFVDEYPLDMSLVDNFDDDDD